MKFLICGFGNIAQRHFKNLIKLQPKSLINIYIQKYDKHRIFDNDLHITYTSNLQESYPINKIFYDFEEALNAEEYNAVILCSLPPERIDMAIKIAKKGIDLFIEKPLSNSMDNVTELDNIITERGLKCCIGYQMRYHPILQEVKKLLNNKKLGELYKIDITHGNSIKNWTKGRKLNSDFYALDTIKGGGVILSQSHEIDYLNWLMEDSFYSLYAYNKFINQYLVENQVSVIGNILNNSKSVPVSINLDFINPKPIREIRIFGTKKTISADLINDYIYDHNLNKTNFYENIKWNDLFLDEMKDFIKLLKNDYTGRKNIMANLFDGINVLKTCLEIKNLQERTI